MPRASHQARSPNLSSSGNLPLPEEEGTDAYHSVRPLRSRGYVHGQRGPPGGTKARRGAVKGAVTQEAREA